MAKSLLGFFSSFGNSNTASSKTYTKNLTYLVTIFSCLTTFSLLVTAIVLKWHILYILNCLTIPVLFFILFILDYHKQSSWARFYGTIVLPTAINIAFITSGGGFGENYAMVAFLIFAYILNYRYPKIRKISIVYIIVSHILVLLYLSNYPAIVAEVNYPYDEVIVFILAISWVFTMLKRFEYEKNKLINKLQSNNEELTETTEELEIFNHIASHDLKSPLRTIISFSDLMNKQIKSGTYKNLERDLDFVRSGAKQMNNLINDMLIFSKINGNTEIEKRELNINQLLKKVETNLYHDILEKKAKLQIANLHSFYGNETEVILLFQNIIQNGIKYNDSEIPLIEIWSEKSETALKFFIKDNGIGMDSEYFEQIFQFFKRLHNANNYKGTGLGLGLCKKLIKKYNGKISVQSALGNGSTFSLEFPIQL